MIVVVSSCSVFLFHVKRSISVYIFRAILQDDLHNFSQNDFLRFYLPENTNNRCFQGQLQRQSMTFLHSLLVQVVILYIYKYCTDHQFQDRIGRNT